MSFVYLNNQFVNADTASLKLNDLALQRGYGVFDFFRTKNQQPLFIDDYLNRFFHSAKKFHLPLGKTNAEIKLLVQELLQRNKFAASGVRMVCTGGYSADGYQIADPNFFMIEQPLTAPNPKIYNEGIKIITYPYQRDFSEIKSLNYVQAVWLQPLLIEQSAADVLYHQNEVITELPRCNIFIVTKNGRVITPQLNVLAGITRSKILKLSLTNIPIQMQERISLADVYAAEEIFITSTTKSVLPVCWVDGKKIGLGVPGPITKKISVAFLKLVEDYFNASV